MERFSVRVFIAACAVTLCAVHIPLFVCAQRSPELLRERIDSLRCAGEFEEARAAGEDLLHLIRSDPDAQPYEIGDAERLVATLELASTLPEGARRELAAAERLTGVYDSLFDADDLESAVEVIDRQLAVKRRYFTERHQEVATCLNIKALFIDYLGHYGEAEPLYRKALDIRRAILEPAHPETSGSLSNFAFVRKLQGHYREAERYNREALQMDRVLFGDEDPSVATDLDNLAGWQAA
jgi:tetratricopeptide (TPR) repeat protein